MLEPKHTINQNRSQWIKCAALILWVAMLGFFFAKVEIQIEGGQGWAASLPTWRIEEHWLLNIFWGGRAMTGYHAWVFSFMFLAFHTPLLMAGRFSLRLETRILGSVALFWMVEDFLWFVLNPVYGIRRFTPEHIPWHKNWFLWMPVDYWVFTGVTVLLFWYSYRSIPEKKTPISTDHEQKDKPAE